MASTEEILEWLNKFFNTQLFKLGSSDFTFKTLTILILSLVLLFFLTSLLSRFLVKKVFPKYNVNVGVSEAIATIIRYILIDCWSLHHFSINRN